MMTAAYENPRKLHPGSLILTLLLPLAFASDAPAQSKPAEPGGDEVDQGKSAERFVIEMQPGKAARRGQFKTGMGITDINLSGYGLTLVDAEGIVRGVSIHERELTKLLREMYPNVGDGKEKAATKPAEP